MVGVTMLLLGPPPAARVNLESVFVTLASCVTFFGGVYGLWRLFSTRSKKSDQFYRDWFGEEERPGVPYRPGVLLRLTALETGQESLSSQVDTIHSEVNYNHGGSIKDAMDRVDRTIKVIDTRLGSVETDVKLIHSQVSAPPPPPAKES